MEFSCRVGLLQIAQIEFSKATRQNLHGQEEAWTAGHPTAAVQGDATTRHDTMQMGMKIEGLSPRMQDAEKADLRSQVLGICCHRLQGIGLSVDRTPAAIEINNFAAGLNDIGPT